MASGRKKRNDSAHQSTPRSVKERALPHYKIAPGPSGHFLLGSTRDIRHDPLRFGLEMVWQYGDIVRIRVLLWPAYRNPSAKAPVIHLGDEAPFPFWRGEGSALRYLTEGIGPAMIGIDVLA